MSTSRRAATDHKKAMNVEAAREMDANAEFFPAGESDSLQIVITDRYAIAAAHSAAFMEDSYRYCRVYGMGKR